MHHLFLNILQGILQKEMSVEQISDGKLFLFLAYGYIC